MSNVGDSYSKLSGTDKILLYNYIMKNKDNYKYLFTEKIDYKENMIIAIESINYKNKYMLSIFGLSILTVRKMLWRRGYFAAFFFHTRFQPFLYFGISLYFLEKNFIANLKKNELYSYYQMRKSTERMDNIAKSMALNLETKNEKMIKEMMHPK